MAGTNVNRRVTEGGVELWRARWRDSDGVQRQRSFRTKQAALKFQAERRADQLRGLERNEERAKDSFRVYADRWLDSMQTEVRARTIEGYEKDLRVHVLPIFGHKPVGRITTSDVIRWVEHMKAKRIAGHGLSPRTIKGALNRLQQVLALAVLDGAVHINVAAGVRAPKYNAKPPKQAFRVRTLGPTEQQALVRAMAELDSTGLDALVTATLLSTGLRAAELCGLEVRDVSPLNRTVAVERTKRYLPGLADPEVGLPKSKNARRVVPVPLSMAHGLGEWLEQHPRRHEPSAPLFPHRHGADLDWQHPIDPNVFRRVSLWPALAHAGLDTDTRLHDLRHTFGSTLVEANQPVEKVSRIMGHSSIHITMSTYVHLDTAQHHDVVEGAVPSFFALQTKPSGSERATG